MFYYVAVWKIIKLICIRRFYCIKFRYSATKLFLIRKEIWLEANKRTFEVKFNYDEVRSIKIYDFWWSFLLRLHVGPIFISPSNSAVSSSWIFYDIFLRVVRVKQKKNFFISRSQWEEQKLGSISFACYWDTKPPVRTHRRLPMDCDHFPIHHRYTISFASRAINEVWIIDPITMSLACHPSEQLIYFHRSEGECKAIN